MKKFTKFLPLGAALLPFSVYAATVTTLIEKVSALVKLAIPLLMAIAVMIFLYGIVKFITAAGDAEKVKEAKSYIIYGLIGLFVMISFWGIIAIFSETFDIKGGNTPSVPTIPTTNL